MQLGMFVIALAFILMGSNTLATDTSKADSFDVEGLAATDHSAARRPAKMLQGSNTQTNRHASRASASYWTQFNSWIVNKQRQLHKELSTGIRQLKNGDTWVAIWSLAFISFIYGVVHAIGPGHGKAVITSYVFANERTLKRGIWLAVLSSIMQAITAVIAVSILAIALDATGLKIQAFVHQLEAASYGMVALIGLWLVISQLRKLIAHWTTAKNSHRSHDHDHHDQNAELSHTHNHQDDEHRHEHAAHDHIHSDDCGCGHNHIPAAESLTDRDWSWKKALSIILAVGIRPCTGAIIVLVFSFVNGLYWAGIASTFAMAIGTAITISTLAVLAVGSKQLALKFYGEQSRSTAVLINIIALVGGLLVLLFSVTLLLSSQGPARPFG